MKYYSEVTGEIFDTIDELDKAEEKIRDEERERAKAEKELKAAYDEAITACDKYLTLAKKHKKTDIMVPESLFMEWIDSFFK